VAFNAGKVKMLNRLAVHLVVISLSTLNALALAGEPRVLLQTEQEKRVFSPDHKHFAFVRDSGKTVDSGKGTVPADAVWYGDTSTNVALPLFEPGAQVDTHQRIGKIPLGDIDELTFSNDGRKLFFLSACYATSEVLMSLDLATRQIQYVTDANSLEAMRSGAHKGFLLITRHTYRSEKEGYGSYEKPAYIKQ
jgi:hypothetical protein